MFTYQVRQRIFRPKPNEELLFPADCTIRFHFLPQQPFGVSAGDGHTAVRAVAATVLFNANNGQHTIESKRPLVPLDVSIQEPERDVQLTGQTLSVSQRFESLQELEQTTMSIFFALPTLLNVAFGDPPYIERVDGIVGKTSFRWEFAAWHLEFRMTTQDQQEKSVAIAWRRIGILSQTHRRRLIAGLHYFHVACRLTRSACTAGEFLGEVLLNLARSLEAIFPPSGDGGTRDAAREGLKELSFTDVEIEGNFLPALLLRSKIDVAHVELGLFTMKQLRVLHAFTERAEKAFSELYDRLLTAIEEDKWDVAPYNSSGPRKEAVDLIDRLSNYSSD